MFCRQRGDGVRHRPWPVERPRGGVDGHDDGRAGRRPDEVHRVRRARDRRRGGGPRGAAHRLGGGPDLGDREGGRRGRLVRNVRTADSTLFGPATIVGVHHGDAPRLASALGDAAAPSPVGGELASPPASWSTVPSSMLPSDASSPMSDALVRRSARRRPTPRPPRAGGAPRGGRGRVAFASTIGSRRGPASYAGRYRRRRGPSTQGSSRDARNCEERVAELVVEVPARVGEGPRPLEERPRREPLEEPEVARVDLVHARDEPVDDARPRGSPRGAGP